MYVYIFYDFTNVLNYKSLVMWYLLWNYWIRIWRIFLFFDVIVFSISIEVNIRHWNLNRILRLTSQHTYIFTILVNIVFWTSQCSRKLVKIVHTIIYQKFSNLLSSLCRLWHPLQKSNLFPSSMRPLIIL